MSKRKPTKPISELVSALASSAKGVSTGEDDYRLESVYVDQLRQQIASEKDQDLRERIDRHSLRKGILWALMGLTFIWLIVVVVFVGWSAVSPTVPDREKIIQLGQQVKVRFCPILFHLSDGVLVAFITSTTLAVLGLFMTAAKWLYADKGATAREKQNVMRTK